MFLLIQIDVHPLRKIVRCYRLIYVATAGSASIAFLRSFLMTDLKTWLLALKVAHSMKSDLGKDLDTPALMPKELHTEYVSPSDVCVWTAA